MLQGLKITEKTMHPDSIYENHIASVFDSLEMMDK